MNLVLPFFLAAVCALAQPAAWLRTAKRVELPPVIDGNSAAFWWDGKLHLMHSTGVPWISEGDDQFTLSPGVRVNFDNQQHAPVWFEAAWVDADGTVFFWYHHEPVGTCGASSSLTSPKVGAAVSYDGGRTIKDLGIVLESPYAPNCSAKNGFFAGGHGDASVILDGQGQYFYFFFTNYGGPESEQGVSVARLAFEDRFLPAGAVRKWHNGAWTEPGIGGNVSPIFPAMNAWENADADSYWGPSVHFNTHLNQYVILLNRACCETRWPQEGIYLTFNTDLASPTGWLKPTKILDGDKVPVKPGYYPQILGLDPYTTDSVGGEVSRLYVHGVSQWEIVFQMIVPTEDPCKQDESLCPAEPEPLDFRVRK